MGNPTIICTVHSRLPLYARILEELIGEQHIFFLLRFVAGLTGYPHAKGDLDAAVTFLIFTNNACDLFLFTFTLKLQVLLPS